MSLKSPEPRFLPANEPRMDFWDWIEFEPAPELGDGWLRVTLEVGGFAQDWGVDSAELPKFLNAFTAGAAFAAEVYAAQG